MTRLFYLLLGAVLGAFAASLLWLALSAGGDPPGRYAVEPGGGFGC